MARRRLAIVIVLPFLLSAVAIGVAFAQVVGRGGGAAPPAGVPNPNIAPMTTGTAAISGVVIDDATRQPVAGAVVYLGPPNRGPQGEPVREITDAKGRFLFTHLPAWDNYSLQVSKFGYFESAFGRSGSGSAGARLKVGDGQWLRDVEIRMRRYGSISGTVIDEHGDPIVNAYVRVLLQVPVTGTNRLASGHVATTDDRGQYRIGALPPGKYFVQMPTVQDSVPATTPARTLAGLPPLSPGAPDSSTALPPTLPIVDLDEQRLLIVGRFPNPPRSPDGQRTIYPITFYPNASTIAGATPVTLAAGEARTGVDLRVAIVTASRISGVVEGPADAYSGMTLRLLQSGLESLGEGSEVATTRVADNGDFMFDNVPTGAYVIEARRRIGGYANTRLIGGTIALPGTPAIPGQGGGFFGVFSGVEGTTFAYRDFGGDPKYWGRQPVVVDRRDINGVRVTMRRGVTISGRLIWEGARPASQIPTQLALQPARGDGTLGVGRAVVNPSAPDTFAFEGVLPGEYLVTGIASPIKSIVCGNVDHTYAPFDTTGGADVTDCVVTFTDKSIVVTGIVRDDRVSPGASIDAAVIVFPVERQQWTAYTFSPMRLKNVNTTAAGAFRFTNLPEGEYYFLALPGDQMTAWQDPAFLERAAAHATRVQLKWGDVTTQPLTLKVVK